jgi:hypothetical protein
VIVVDSPRVGRCANTPQIFQGRGRSSGTFTDQPRPGHPAYVVTGRVSAAVTAITLIQDGSEDRRDLHSYFGALVICTEHPSPYQINALDTTGAIIGSIDGPPRF